MTRGEENKIYGVFPDHSNVQPIPAALEVLHLLYNLILQEFILLRVVIHY
jgi:hypothetical protein